MIFNPDADNDFIHKIRISLMIFTTILFIVAVPGIPISICILILWNSYTGKKFFGINYAWQLIHQMTSNKKSHK